jgi:DNA-binding IclR family transcriptional regulator
VSAPVVANDGSVVAAISVSGPVGRITREPGTRHGAALVDAAAEVAAALG